MILAVATVVVFAMLVVMAVYFVPKLVEYLQPLDRLYNFEHHANIGEPHLRTQTPLGIIVAYNFFAVFLYLVLGTNAYFYMFS